MVGLHELMNLNILKVVTSWSTIFLFNNAKIKLHAETMAKLGKI